MAFGSCRLLPSTTQGSCPPRWLSRFRYNRAVPLSFAVFGVGAALCAPLVVDYVQRGYTLGPIGRENHLAVLGLLAMVCGFMSFTFTLVLHATQVRRRR